MNSVNLFTTLKEMKILLIDDDEWIRDSMTLFFESEGCNIFVVETAEEGIEASIQHVYDIVVVDYRLPGMDGIEFFRQTRKYNEQAIKILITAFSSSNVTLIAREAGVDELIEKPFTHKDIEDALKRLIAKRRTDGPAS